MLLPGLMDVDLLARMLEEGMVRQQLHPELPLTILNYTEKATFSRTWNEVTLQCRGLIFNTITDEVVARPFPKFFNYGEDQTSQSFDDYRNSRVVVTDKLDGSLGILYSTEPWEPGWAIATRGSFTSPQALHATERLQDYVDKGWFPQYGETYLFEIIYPQNRIVCDYGSMDDLVLLGTVNNDWGYSAGPFRDWPGPKAKVFSYGTFEEALSAQPRQGAEGLVVHFPDRDMRLKLKQADYVALHRIVTGLNERAVWAFLQEGKSTEEICAPLPEEFWPWVEDVSAKLQDLWFDIWDEVQLTFKDITARLPRDFTRKDFALEATGTTHAGMLFKLLDKQDIGPSIWARIKPAHTIGPWQRGEDNA